MQHAVSQIANTMIEINVPLVNDWRDGVHAPVHD